MSRAIIFLALTTLVGCGDTRGPFIKYQKVEGAKVPHFFYRTKWSKTTPWYDYNTVPIPCTKAKTKKEKFMCGL